MGLVLVNEQNLIDIADAIRTKNGTTNTYLPSQMAAAITGIVSYDTGNWDSTPAFEQDTFTFDGTNYLDTGLQLFNTDKAWKIDFTYQSDKSSFSSAAVVAHCMNEANPYPGFSLDTNNNNSYRFATYPTLRTTTIPKNSMDANHIILSYVPGEDKIVIQENDNITEVAFTYTQISQTLIFGAYRTTSNSIGRYWTGTMSNIKVYFEKSEEGGN